MNDESEKPVNPAARMSPSEDHPNDDINHVVNIIKTYVKDLIDEADKRYNHRFDAQGDLFREKDKRDEQRFIAQESAVQAALLAQKEAVAAALSAADRAVAKAEIAYEKRFESVNEFRQALSDQTSGLTPRTESDQRFRSIEDKMNAITTIFNEKVGGVQKWQNEQSGMKVSTTETTQKNMWLIALIFTVIALFGSAGISSLIAAYMSRK